MTTDILGAITDKGTIQLNGGDGNNGILDLTGAMTLSGGGVVAMTTAAGGGDAFIEGNSETLTNDDVIEGTGQIGNGSLAVTNSGTIDANSSAGALTLDGSGGVTNPDRRIRGDEQRHSAGQRHHREQRRPQHHGQ